jgi:hypothetical protein
MPNWFAAQGTDDAAGHGLPTPNGLPIASTGFAPLKLVRLLGQSPQLVQLNLEDGQVGVGSVPITARVLRVPLERPRFHQRSRPWWLLVRM